MEAMGEHNGRTQQRSSVLRYLVGTALGAVALGLTAWIALRNRGANGSGATGSDGADAADLADWAVDEDLV